MNKKPDTKKILAICIALVMITASLLFKIESPINARAQASRAAAISSLTTYSVPGGDPWGTTFDSSGRVWVALPGSVRTENTEKCIRDV